MKTPSVNWGRDDYLDLVRRTADMRYAGMQCGAIPRRYLCERCGGSGVAYYKPHGGTPNNADGTCGLCDGQGFLGIVK